MAQDMGGMMAALKDTMLRRRAQEGIAQAMPNPAQGAAQDLMRQRQQQISLASMAPSLASPAVQAPGSRAVQPLDMKEAVMAREQAMKQQQMQYEMGQQQAMAGQQQAMQQRQAQMSAEMASLGQRAPLLARDMMRKQMGQQMAQAQPMGARASLINAKRGMAQGGKGGRSQGGMRTALNQMSQRQAQGRA